MVGWGGLWGQCLAAPTCMYTLDHDIHHSFQSLITSNGGFRIEAGSLVDRRDHRLSKRLGSSVNICNELVCKYLWEKMATSKSSKEMAVLIPVYRVYFGETLKYLTVLCFCLKAVYQI